MRRTTLGKVGGLFEVKGAVEQGRCGFWGEFAVAEPLIEDLVSAEGAIPDMDGDGGPMGFAVQINIDAGFAEEGEGRIKGEGLWS